MGFSVTCRELPGLIRQLAETSPELAKEAKRNIRNAERPAMEAVRASAAAAGMFKAAGAVVPANRFGGGVASLAIKVDGRRAPNARPLDRPNNPPFDRHPVFGNRRNWVNQPGRPFFNRGADKAFTECQKQMEQALEQVVRWLAR